METENHAVEWFALRNLRCLDTVPMSAPWEWKAGDAPWHLPKPDWESWAQQPDTEHRFISLCKGSLSGLRITDDNPPVEAAGFIADYDGVVPDDALESVRKQAPNGFKPAWLIRTKSGHARLVWLFEFPIRFVSYAHASRFLAFTADRLQASHWFGGYDAKSERPNQYQDIGTSWAKVSDYRIAAGVVQKWSYDVFRRILAAERSRAKATIIPMSILRDEARRRGWQHVPAFEEGARCRRFWDPDSDRDDGCIIHADGVQIFVPKEQPFRRWADIFGREFTAKYESEKYQTLAAERVYWHRAKGKFWTKDSQGVWSERPLPSLVRELKVAGWSAKVPPGGTCSEVDEILALWEAERPVDSVKPFLYGPEGAWRTRTGQISLNCSRVKVVPPGPPQTVPGADWTSKGVRSAFPFIHGLISHLFDYAVDGMPAGWPTQLQWILWWLAVFYRSGFERSPQLGQAVYIAGNPSQGKSFFAKQLIPALMGGEPKDAGAFLTGRSKWSDHLAGSPTLNVDDEKSTITVEVRNHLKSLIKKIVSDGELEFAQKFGDEGSMPWYGRILVTLNTDVRSLSILPTLDSSDSFKSSFLLTGGHRAYSGFGSLSYNQSKLDQELPAFARYLIDLCDDIPKSFQDQRYGIRHFHHPILTRVAGTSDSVATLVEAMEMAFAGLDEPDAKTGAVRVFEGTASALYTLLAQSSLAFKCDFRSPRQLGQELTKMVEQGWNIKRVVTPGSSGNRYIMPYDVWKQGVSEARAAEAESGVQ